MAKLSLAAHLMIRSVGYRAATNYLFVVSILLLVTCRLVTANVQIDHDDELYLLIARAWSSGYIPYKDIYDHKPPFVYVLYWLLSGGGNWMWTVRIAVCIALVSAAITFSNAVVRRMNGSHAKQLLIVAFILGFLTLQHGLGSNTELLYIPPLLLTLAYLLRGQPVAAAAMAATAVLIKYTALLDLIALGTVYFVLESDSHRFRKTAGRFQTVFATTIVIVYGCLVIYFQWHGVQLLDYIVKTNLHHGAHRTAFLALNPFVGNLAFVFVLCIALWFVAGRNFKDVSLFWATVLWVGMDFLQGAATGQYYGHYFLPLCIPLGLMFANVKLGSASLFWLALLLALTSIGLACRSTERRFRFTETAGKFRPVCGLLMSGGYVLDDFIAAYRVCGVRRFDRFVFWPFYVEPHFVNLSHSGGIDSLRFKVKSQQVPAIVVQRKGSEPSGVADHFRDMNLVEVPLCPGHDCP